MVVPATAGGSACDPSPPDPAGNPGVAPPPSPASPPRQDHPLAARIRFGGEFSRVFNHQQKAAGRFAVVLVRARARQRRARLGMMVPAKTVRTAVRRHAIKRWIRELFRTRLAPAMPGVDLVVLIRADPTEQGGHAALDRELLALLPKALAAKPQPGGRDRRRR